MLSDLFDLFSKTKMFALQHINRKLFREDMPPKLFLNSSVVQDAAHLRRATSQFIHLNISLNAMDGGTAGDGGGGAVPRKLFSV